MKVICRHGYFSLYPSDKTEVQRFMRVFGLALWPVEDYFTFEALLDLPRWSQVGRAFGNLPAVATYEGRAPWDVMRENGFVFSFAAELLIPVAAVVQTVTLAQTADCAVALQPLLQPGAFLEPGVRLLNYWAELDLNYQRLYLYAWEES